MSYENLQAFLEMNKSASALGTTAKGLGAAGLGALVGRVATRRREGEDDADFAARRRRMTLAGGGAGLATYGAGRGIAALRRPKPELRQVRGLIGGPGEAPEQLQRLRAQMRDSERQGRGHAFETFIERATEAHRPAQSPVERVAKTVAPSRQRASSALQLGYDPSVVNTPSASVPGGSASLPARKLRDDVVRATPQSAAREANEAILRRIGLEQTMRNLDVKPPEPIQGSPLPNPFIGQGPGGAQSMEQIQHRLAAQTARRFEEMLPSLKGHERYTAQEYIDQEQRRAGALSKRILAGIPGLTQRGYAQGS